MRLYQFGALPLSLNRDEVALGYNAFAIMESGIDEWGQKLPLTFKSFGDYKLPGYIYTLVSIIKAFGVSEATIRLPSLLAGLALIPLAYLLAKKLLGDREKALWVATLMAISPWSIFYSRVAFEANLALAFFVGSLLCLLDSSTTQKKVGGFILYALSIATYNTPLMLMPIVLVMLFLKKTTIKQKLFESACIVLISIGWLSVIQNIVTQKAGITIFNDPTIVSQQSEARTQAVKLGDKIISSKMVYQGRLMIQNTLASISPKFMILDGGSNPWHQIPHSGLIPKTAYVLAVIALVQMVITKNKRIIIITLLFIAGLAPSIVTVDAPHVTRSLFSLLLVLLLAGSAIPTKSKRVTWLLSAVLLIEVCLFATNYFIAFPQNHDAKWQVGLKEMISQARGKYPNDLINVTNPQNQPYIYVLLYQAVKPEDFSSTVVRYGKDSSGLDYVKSFDEWVFIGDPKDVPGGIPIIHQDQTGSYSLK
jgi:4-amino-4-deoxy-L-arabinose transferase-like glycosyltransferase